MPATICGAIISITRVWIINFAWAGLLGWGRRPKENKVMRFSISCAIRKQGYAFLNQLRYQVANNYKVMLIHRFYSYDYWGMFAHSFGENSALQNENGWFLGGEASLFARWRFFGAIDLFSFPWWKYRISKPSQGVDGLFQATFTPNKRWSMYANYRFKRKERDVTGSGGETILPTYHHKVRYRLNFVQDIWSLRTTFDYNHFSQPPLQYSQGWQATQSLSIRLRSMVVAFVFPLICVMIFATG